MNPVSLAPLAPISFLSVQILCLLPKEGALSNRCCILASPQKLHWTLSTPEPFMEDTEDPQTGGQTRPWCFKWGKGRRDGDSWPCGPDRETILGKSLCRGVWPAAIIFSQSPRHAWVGVTGRMGIEAVQTTSSRTLLFLTRTLGMYSSSITWYRFKACAQINTASASPKAPIEASLLEDKTLLPLVPGDGTIQVSTSQAAS